MANCCRAGIKSLRGTPVVFFGFFGFFWVCIIFIKNKKFKKNPKKAFLWVFLGGFFWGFFWVGFLMPTLVLNVNQVPDP
jgi:hypothetical protein